MHQTAQSQIHTLTYAHKQNTSTDIYTQPYTHQHSHTYMYT